MTIAGSETEELKLEQLSVSVKCIKSSSSYEAKSSAKHMSIRVCQFHHCKLIFDNTISTFPFFCCGMKEKI